VISVPPHGRLRVDLPGGGGFGDARLRDKKQVALDLLNGMISVAPPQEAPPNPHSEV